MRYKQIIISHLFKLNKFSSFKRCILIPLQQVNTLTSPSPLLPLLLQFLPHSFYLMLLQFISNSHVRSKSIMLFVDQLWEFSSDLVVDLLHLIAISDGINEAYSMREAGNFLKSNLKSKIIFEFLTQYLIDLVKSCRINEGEADIDMWWPSIECRIMFLSD